MIPVPKSTSIYDLFYFCLTAEAFADFATEGVSIQEVNEALGTAAGIEYGYLLAKGRAKE